MKKLRDVLVFGALAAMFLMPLQSDAGVKVYLRFGPPRLKRVKVIKPARLCRNAIWVAGHWRYKNVRYGYVDGYWVKPRHGYVYVQACWVKTPRGYYFAPGHWVKK